MTREKTTSAKNKSAKEILALLRRRITEGPWGAGTRIPTKIELRQELGASDGTVQKALDSLTAQGFLRSRGRLGTWVCDRPPHLHRIGLVCENPCVGMWLETVRAVAERLTHDGHHWLRCYFNCQLKGRRPSPELHQLEEDVATSQLAGAIFIGPPWMLPSTRAMTQPGLARVRIGKYDPAQSWPTIHWRPFHARAMQRFREQGRRRLGVITTFHFLNEDIELLLQSAGEHGLETHRSWIHFFDERIPHSGRAVCELMMSLPKESRPDALYINDDHLVTEATLGIADSAIPVPQDLTIIAHANFPSTPPAAVPVTYLGIDHETLLRTALNILDKQIDGQKVSDMTWFEPVFDFERAANHRQPPPVSRPPRKR